MLEYHGWATIRISCSKEAEYEQENVINQIKTFIKELNWPTGVLDFRAVNGEYHIWIAGFDNHKPNTKYDPLTVFGYICNAAPFSYGILYIRDDEDKEGFDNEFMVHVMTRGGLEVKRDKFLSPFIPKVEDEFIG